MSSKNERLDLAKDQSLRSGSWCKSRVQVGHLGNHDTQYSNLKTSLIKRSFVQRFQFVAVSVYTVANVHLIRTCSYLKSNTFASPENVTDQNMYVQLEMSRLECMQKCNLYWNIQGVDACH